MERSFNYLMESKITFKYHSTLECSLIFNSKDWYQSPSIQVTNKTIEKLPIKELRSNQSQELRAQVGLVSRIDPVRDDEYQTRECSCSYNYPHLAESNITQLNFLTNATTII